MGFRINTNVPALAGQRAVQKAGQEKEQSLEKLASGDRINQASDDASGLAISEKLKAGIRSSQQAGRNATNGISLVQTAEGGLTETSNILVRMRELAIQAASDTNGDTERALTNKEFMALKNEIQRISQTTEFNGRKLLNGADDRLDFHVGMSASSNDQISYNSHEVNADINSLGLSSVTLSSKYSAQNSLEKLDQAIGKLTGHRAKLGSLQNRLTSSSSNLAINTESLSAANSRIRDADYALEASNNARNNIIESASTTVLAQANTHGSNALKLVE